jgi:hypothetical protein
MGTFQKARVFQMSGNSGQKSAFGFISTSVTVRKREHNTVTYFFTTSQQPPVGQGFFTVEDSWSHSDTPHLVGLLRTSDQTDAGTSTWQHTTVTRDTHPCPPRDSNPQSQQASGRRPTLQTVRPLGSAVNQIHPRNLRLIFRRQFWPASIILFAIITS